MANDDHLQETTFTMAPADIVPGRASDDIACVNTTMIAVPEVEEVREQTEEDGKEASAYDHPPTQDAQWDTSFEDQGHTHIYVLLCSSDSRSHCRALRLVC